MKNPQTTISGWIAAAMSLLTIIAAVPTGLQAQLMSVFAKTWQPYTALFFAVAAFVAKGYQSNATQDKLPDAATTSTPLADHITATTNTSQKNP